MTRKPSGRKYRNLVAFRGSIWYERIVGGKRDRFDLETTSWKEAADARDYYERRKGIARERTVTRHRELAFLSEFAPRYLDEDTEHLGARTLRDRRRYLKPDGLLLGDLGHLRLDDVTPALLRTWWAKAIQGEGRAVQTGRHYINTLAAIYQYAEDLELVSENPVDEFRRRLRRKSRTKRGRADARRDRYVRPVEDLKALTRIIDAAQDEGPLPYAYVLAHLDAESMPSGGNMWCGVTMRTTGGVVFASQRTFPKVATEPPKTPSLGIHAKLHSPAAYGAPSSNFERLASRKTRRWHPPKRASSTGSTGRTFGVGAMPTAAGARGRGVGCVGGPGWGT